MRVWDCDPRELCDKHLLAQHLEIHCILTILLGGGRGYANHPEVVRFREHQYGVRWLNTFHEFTRIAMNVRYGGHDGFHHPSPILGMPFDSLVEAYYKSVKGVRQIDLNAFDAPRTRLEHGTPWERDGVSKEWYLEHHKDWSHALVQALHEEAKVFDKADLADMTREEVVVMKGGRPHIM